MQKCEVQQNIFGFNPQFYSTKLGTFCTFYMASDFISFYTIEVNRVQCCFGPHFITVEVLLKLSFFVLQKNVIQHEGEEIVIIF